MAGFFESLGDFATDLGRDITSAASDYVKGTVEQKLAADKKADPNSQPPASVGENGLGGGLASQPIAPVFTGVPKWALPVGLGVGGLLVAGLLFAMLRK